MSSHLDILRFKIGTPSPDRNKISCSPLPLFVPWDGAPWSIGYWIASIMNGGLKIQIVEVYSCRADHKPPDVNPAHHFGRACYSKKGQALIQFVSMTLTASQNIIILKAPDSRGSQRLE